MTISATPVELQPGAPRLYAVLLTIAALAAVISVLVSGLPIPVQVLLALLTLVIAARAWKSQSRWTGARVRLHRDGSGDWKRAGMPAELRGRLVAHWQGGPLVTLVLQAEGGIGEHVRLALWRDQIDADAWRRLVILLRHDRHGGGALG